MRTFLLIITFLVTACTQQTVGFRSSSSFDSSESSFLVTHVADGDTITIELPNGSKESVRFLGINAPEIKHGLKPAQCFGDETKEYIKKRLLNQKVMLTKKPDEDRDRFGRLLRYVLMDGIDIDAELVQKGFAINYCDKYPHPKCEEYEQLEKEAREAKRGLWGKCEKNYKNDERR
jgi:micrococcal nuclease